eukprot:NODE_47_length_32105_cov_1.240892.p9 type:complete len:324 gc:universal NODE_47_length_32105_cov_1.240892:31207-30236(-)
MKLSKNTNQMIKSKINKFAIFFDTNMISIFNVAKDHPFPIQNIPFGIFSTNNIKRGGTIIGENVIDLSLLCKLQLLKLQSNPFDKPYLNDFMEMGKPVWQSVRHQIQELFKKGSNIANHEKYSEFVIPVASVKMHLPAKIGDYTDFYASKEHATNVGTMFRGKDNALMPNWTHLPVGYHGRASSIVISGTPITRPNGQLKTKDPHQPAFGPSKRLDFELEMAFFVGKGNELGQPIPISEANDHIFGVVLMNDWSARDIQAFEYVPLGPFLGKNFGTSISPWIVTLDALEPFKCQGPPQNPSPMSYLTPTNGPKNRKLNSFRNV